MHAVQYQAYGGYQENRVVDLPVPMARDGEVLVQMRTVGVNPLDNTFRAGHHPAANAQNLPRIGGQTGVGVVVEKGQSSFAAGDRVIVFGAGFGRTADGTWREYVAASPAALSPVSYRLPGANGICPVSARPDGSRSRHRWRGRDGNGADRRSPGCLDGNLDRQHDSEGTAGAGRRL